MDGTGGGVSDGPTDGDLQRLSAARRAALARVADVEATRAGALLEAFREEIGTTIRSASPLLAPMLAIEGLTLDDAAAMLVPPAGWPRLPRLADRAAVGSMQPRLLRRYLAHSSPMPGLPRSVGTAARPDAGIRRDQVRGGHLRVGVVGHSLELDARVGPVRIRTRFGELRVRFDLDLPHTVFASSVGRLIEDLVDYDAWRGRGWRIATIEDGGGCRDRTLVIATGSVDYTMPWAR